MTNPNLLLPNAPSPFSGFIGFSLIFFSSILVFLLIFLILRAFVLWYWKVNKIVALLESIDAKLNRLPAPAPKAMEQPASITK